MAARIFAAALAAALAGPAAAQTVPEGQSCGGLFCDMGIIGHKTAPAPAPVAAPAPVVEAAPAAAPRAARPRRHLAATPRHPARAARRELPRQEASRQAAVAPPPAPAAPPPAPAAAPVRTAAAPRPARALPAAATPLIPLPTAPAVAVEMPKPKMFYFQSVDPTLQ